MDDELKNENEDIEEPGEEDLEEGEEEDLDLDADDEEDEIESMDDHDDL